MLFSEVIGQEEIKIRLRASVSAGRIAHAQLFFGPDGSGALPLVIAYAQYINCNNRQPHDSCGTCSSCRKYEKLVHPDLHFAFPVNTGKKISKDPKSDDYIDDWRNFVLANPYFRSNQWYDFIGLENKQGLINRSESEAIIRKLNLKAFEATYKILIIWLPEKMNATSANMLLKLIEEPPPNTIFLLVAEDPGQLLITISSRTQPLKLRPIDNESLIQAIEKKYSLNRTQVESVVHIANGSMIQVNEAIQSSEENDFNLEKFIELMRLCYKRSYFDINNWVDEMSQLGREKQKTFFDYALHMVRENLMLNLQNPDLVYLSEKESDFSSKFHPYINGINVMGIYNEMNQASADIERNGYAKIVLFDFAFRLVKLIESAKVKQ